MTPLKKQLTDSFRDLRKLRRLSQAQLALRTGRAQTRISEIETAQQDPRLSTILAVADALDAELLLVPREKLGRVRQLIRPDGAVSRPSPPDIFDELFVPDPPHHEE